MLSLSIILITVNSHLWIVISNRPVRISTQKTIKIYDADILLMEAERNLSIKSTPVTLSVQCMCEKMYLFNILDIPGYVNDSDKTMTDFGVTDVLCLVPNTTEDELLGTKLPLRRSLQDRLPVIRCVDEKDY
ncbi:hypothetical protein FGIG_05636 [Fasciola gigantica]|uniref:Tr-type G domain-containing protein n=1 Tax=Fasciola gigantica TaxID=46835 RepID=A0A504YP34_FASGI|nr:hypothetical protein FGIG_05636 [Fasciola gigantica]